MVTGVLLCREKYSGKGNRMHCILRSNIGPINPSTGRALLGMFPHFCTRVDVSHFHDIAQEYLVSVHTEASCWRGWPIPSGLELGIHKLAVLPRLTHAIFPLDPQALANFNWTGAPAAVETQRQRGTLAMWYQRPSLSGGWGHCKQNFNFLCWLFPNLGLVLSASLRYS